jgi:branched-chain amino acid transport system substrate-binding protein
MTISRRRALAAGGALLSTMALPGALRAQGKPIRIGSTLPLTGPLASLGIIHKVSAARWSGCCATTSRSRS